MTSVELIQAGRLTEALKALQGEVRQNPADSKLRVFLFQLDCVLGEWEKALNQLQVIASLNAETMMLAQIFRPVIACEMLRSEVFAGKRTPMIFGEPAEWVGWLVQANMMAAEGKIQAASELWNQAYEAAPATPGKVDGQACEWIADADSRLGPVLEVILEGKYYWIPFCRIAKIEIEKPSDLRDLVWIPAQFTWTNGGAVSGHIPVRYPGSEKEAEDAVRLGRKTVWNDAGQERFFGLGQRVLTTESGEFSLLDCRSIDLTQMILTPS